MSAPCASMVPRILSELDKKLGGVSRLMLRRPLKHISSGFPRSSSVTATAVPASPGGRQGRGDTGGGSEMVLAFCIKWMYDWTGLMDLIYFFIFSQVRRKRHANIYLRPGGRAPV